MPLDYEEQHFVGFDFNEQQMPRFVLDLVQKFFLRHHLRAMGKGELGLSKGCLLWRSELLNEK